MDRDNTLRNKQGNDYGFVFESERAEQYFYKVVTGDDCYKNERKRRWAAWDAAHKFGSRVTSENMASCRDGIFAGKRALEAAEFADEQIESFYARCPVYNRSHHMAEFKSTLYPEVEAMYDVKFERM